MKMKSLIIGDEPIDFDAAPRRHLMTGRFKGQVTYAVQNTVAGVYIYVFIEFQRRKAAYDSESSMI